jgi:hypothetical protein
VALLSLYFLDYVRYRIIIMMMMAMNQQHKEQQRSHNVTNSAKNNGGASTSKAPEFAQGQEDGLTQEKNLRRNLHKLLNDTKERQHEIASCPMKVMMQMEQANSLILQVNRPTDASLDSEVMNLLAHAGVEIVRKAAQGSSMKYNVDDYIRRLKHTYVDEADRDISEDAFAFQWQEVGGRFETWFRPAPKLTHMLGPMDAAPPAKRVVAQKRAKRVIVGEGVRPEMLGDLEEIVQQGDGAMKETDKNMENMWKRLGEQPQSKAYMVELCINHDSFAQTIENIFTLSFLVRDGRVSLSNSPEGIVVTRQTGGGRGGGRGGDGQHQNQQKDKERVQFVMTLSMKQWSEWKQLVRRENALMPSRTQNDEGAHESQQPKKSKKK